MRYTTNICLSVREIKKPNAINARFSFSECDDKSQYYLEKRKNELNDKK